MAQDVAPRVIEPQRGLALPSVRELWEQRDVLYMLSKRGVAARYKQSTIGVFWAVLQPLLLAVVFSIFLGRYAHVPSLPHVPYPPFAVSGMVLWLFFAGAMQAASISTVANEMLISKVYFPRVIIPLAAVAPAVLDFCVGFVVVLAAVFVYGIVPPVQVFLVPVVALLTLSVATGVGFWLSALNVRYRDVHQAIPFLILVGLFVSPITYPFSSVPASVRTIYALNPVVGLLQAYRWMLFPGTPWPGWIVIVPAVASVLLLLSGAAYFHRAERTFADII